MKKVFSTLVIMAESSANPLGKAIDSSGKFVKASIRMSVSWFYLSHNIFSFSPPVFGETPFPRIMIDFNLRKVDIISIYHTHGTLFIISPTSFCVVNWCDKPMGSSLPYWIAFKGTTKCHRTLCCAPNISENKTWRWYGQARGMDV